MVRPVVLYPQTKSSYLTESLGTPLYGITLNSEGVPEENSVIRAGIFDDLEVLNQKKPDLEIYTASRVKWLAPIEGAGQFPGMLPQP